MADVVQTDVAQPEVKIKKKPQNFYFTQETEDSIVEYNNTSDDVIRNKIYTDKIHPALYKLSEIMLHRFKFYQFDISHEDIKHEVVVFLHEKLCKYDQSTGFKAYSYFSIVAKNYLIAENNKNYYQYKKKDKIEAIDIERNIVNEELRKEFIEEQAEFMDVFVDLLDQFLPLLYTKLRDIQIADSVLHLFKNRENIENYNKKALYIMIREQTNAKAQYVTAVIKQMKLMYDRLYVEYKDGNEFDGITWYDFKDIIED